MITLKPGNAYAVQDFDGEEMHFASLGMANVLWRIRSATRVRREPGFEDYGSYLPRGWSNADARRNAPFGNHSMRG